jgi:predicted nucleotidyltransferase
MNGRLREWQAPRAVVIDLELEPSKAALKGIAERYGLDLIVLFGSHATGQARQTSDVDVAVRVTGGGRKRSIAGRPCDVLEREGRLVNDLSDALQAAENLDLTMLNHASPLLRYQVARSGRPLYQAEPTTFTDFWLLALKSWRESQPRYQARGVWLRERIAGWVIDAEVRT